MSRSHVWDPKPHVTVEYGPLVDPQSEPAISLSANGEFLVALWPTLGILRFWGLEEPDRFLELSYAKSSLIAPTVEIRLTIEGNEVRTTWVESSSNNKYVLRWKTWELDSGEPIDEGMNPIAVYSFENPLRLLTLLGRPEYAGFLGLPVLVNTNIGPGLCCLSSDGRLLAFYDGLGQNIRVYLTSNGEELLVFSFRGLVPYNTATAGLRFCCDDNTIICAACGWPIQYFVVCNIRKREVLVRSIDVAIPDIHRWVTDEDGKYLACNTGREIHVLDIAKNSLLQRISTNMACPRALSAAPLLVAAVANDGTVRVWDIERARQLDPTPESSGSDNSSIGSEVQGGILDNHRAHEWLPSPDNKKTILLCARNFTLGEDQFLLGYTFSPDSTMFVVCFHGSSAVDLYLSGYYGSPTSSGSGIADHSYLDSPLCDGVFLAVFTISGSHDHPRFLYNWTMQLYQEPTEWPQSPKSGAIAFCKDQSLLIYSVAQKDHVVVGVIDLPGREHEKCSILVLPDGQENTKGFVPQAVCASADQSLIAMSSHIKNGDHESSNIFVWKDSAHDFRAVGFERHGVSLLKFSNSSEFLAAVSGEGHIKIFRVPKCSSLLSVPTHDKNRDLEFVDQIPSLGRIREMEFSAENKSLETNLGRIRLFQDRGPMTIAGLSLDNHWICMQGIRLVYLPPEYRPDSDTWELLSDPFIIRNSCVWIKTHSWCFVMIEFDLDLVRRLIRDGELV